MMEKLKIAGTWAGVLEEVELDTWTIPMLREKVANRTNCAPDSINLICTGRVLKDGDGTHKLTQLGIKNNSKILAIRVSPQERNSLKQAEEKCSRRLARVRTVANALAERHVDGSLPIEEFNIEIEDQSEQIVQLGSETDQRAVMMGLMRHAKEKRLIRRRNYKDGLESLKQSETLAWILDVLEGIHTYIEQRFDQIDINTRLEALEDCHLADGGRVVRQGNYKDGLELLKPSETLARILAALEELRTYIEKRFDQVDINLAEMNARIKALEDRLAAENGGAVMMGLMLQAKEKHLIRLVNYKDGLELLKPSETWARILAAFDELRTYTEQRFDQIDINMTEMKARLKVLLDMALSYDDHL